MFYRVISLLFIDAVRVLSQSVCRRCIENLKVFSHHPWLFALSHLQKCSHRLFEQHEFRNKNVIRNSATDRSIQHNPREPRGPPRLPSHNPVSSHRFGSDDEKDEISYRRQEQVCGFDHVFETSAEDGRVAVFVCSELLHALSRRVCWGFM